LGINREGRKGREGKSFSIHVFKSGLAPEKTMGLKRSAIIWYGPAGWFSENGKGLSILFPLRPSRLIDVSNTD
jgi:hypothetical protein